jgi:hypothetical protein
VVCWLPRRLHAIAAIANVHEVGDIFSSIAVDGYVHKDGRAATAPKCLSFDPFSGLSDISTSASLFGARAP